MKLIVLALACLAIFASAQTVNREVDACTESGIIIDDFSIISGTFDKTAAEQGTTTTTVNTHPITGASGSFVFSARTFPTSSGAPDHILGGFRDTIVYIDQNSQPAPSPGQGVAININVGADSTGIVRPQLRYSTDQGIRGIAELQWDGNSDSGNPRNFVKTGLGGLNLVAVADSFTIDLDDTDLPSRFRVEAWSYAGGNAANSRGVYFEWDPASQSSQVFAFTQFIPIGAAIDPVDVFSNLGAMRLFIRDDSPQNPEVDLVIFSLAIRSQFCIWKSASVTRTISSNVDDRFPLFFGPNADILTPNCATDAVEVGTRLTFFIQSYSEQNSAVTYLLKDTVPAGLAIVPTSVSTYTHGASGTAVRATVTSVTPAELVVNVTIASSEASARISVFFDAIVTSAAISSGNCEAQISNRASLQIGTTSIPSANYDGLDDEHTGPTTFCVRGDITFELSQTISATTASAGESFTVNNLFRNSGDLVSANTFVTVQVTGAASLTNAGFTNQGSGFYSRNIGDLSPSSSSTSFLAEFDIADDAPNSVINVEVCVTNVESELPEFCQHTVCRDVDIRVGTESDVKLCKRGHLVRKLCYSIDYYNCGDGDAHDVVITEVIPIGTHIIREESDERWVCNSTHCWITLDVLAAGAVECAPFCVLIGEEIHACTEFENVVTIQILDPDTQEEDTSDNWAYWSIQQSHCPLPEPPEEPECCDCPLPPPPPAMCPCPEPDPCDECYEHDECDEDYDDEECDGHGHGHGHGHSHGTTTINFDFSAEDLV